MIYADKPKKVDNVSRYDYLYSDTELQAFVNRILELLMHTKIVQLFFNYHAKIEDMIDSMNTIHREIILQHIMGRNRDYKVVN